MKILALLFLSVCSVDALLLPRKNQTFRLLAAAEEWTVPLLKTSIQIGSPSKTFNFQCELDFEDVFIVGDKCTSIACKGDPKNGVRNVYVPSKSSTSKDAGVRAALKYGTRTVIGEYYQDAAKVDGITDNAFGVAVLSTSDPDFYAIPADGIFGLSMLGVYRARGKLPSPVDSVLDGASVKTVNLWFNRAKSNADRFGSVTFGSVDTKKCSSSIHYSDIQSDDFLFQVTKLKYVKLTSHRVSNAQLDLGSPYITLPTVIYKAVLRQIGASSDDSYVSCSSYNSYNLDLQIGGQYYTLKSEDFLYPTSTTSSTYCYHLFRDGGDGLGATFSLGEPFFRRFCTTFDVLNKRIGFSTSN